MIQSHDMLHRINLRNMMIASNIKALCRFFQEGSITTRFRIVHHLCIVHILWLFSIWKSSPQYFIKTWLIDACPTPCIAEFLRFRPPIFTCITAWIILCKIIPKGKPQPIRIRIPRTFLRTINEAAYDFHTLFYGECAQIVLCWMPNPNAIAVICRFRQMRIMCL